MQAQELSSACTRMGAHISCRQGNQSIAVKPYDYRHTRERRNGRVQKSFKWRSGHLGKER